MRISPRFLGDAYYAATQQQLRNEENLLAVP